MLRIILGVIASLFSWIVLISVGNRLIRAGWHGYALAEPTMDFNLAMLLARLVLSLTCSLAAGWVARLVGKNALTAWVSGTLLLLIFIPIHCGSDLFSRC